MRTYILPFSEVGNMISTLKVRKLRIRETKKPAQAHKASPESPQL